jgi:hypothetical protein
MIYRDEVNNIISITLYNNYFKSIWTSDKNIILKYLVYNNINIILY